MVSGRSTTRYPLLSAPMSSSDDWYWGWVRVTPVATSTRIARNPKEVSVTRCPVSTDTSQAKTRVPSRRTGSVEPFVPSRRDPVTKSASPVSSGSSSSGNSVTSYWPSASVVTTYRAPRAAARWYPRRSAAPWPRFTGTSTVTAPCARPRRARQQRERGQLVAPGDHHHVPAEHQQHPGGQEQQGRPARPATPEHPDERGGQCQREDRPRRVPDGQLVPPQQPGPRRDRHRVAVAVPVAELPHRVQGDQRLAQREGDLGTPAPQLLSAGRIVHPGPGEGRY